LRSMQVGERWPAGRNHSLPSTRGNQTPRDTQNMRLFRKGQRQACRHRSKSDRLGPAHVSARVYRKSSKACRHKEERFPGPTVDNPALSGRGGLSDDCTRFASSGGAYACSIMEDGSERKRDHQMAAWRRTWRHQNSLCLHVVLLGLAAVEPRTQSWMHLARPDASVRAVVRPRPAPRTGRVFGSKNRGRGQSLVPFRHLCAAQTSSYHLKRPPHLNWAPFEPVRAFLRVIVPTKFRPAPFTRPPWLYARQPLWCTT
jgi:hypothetical protein